MKFALVLCVLFLSWDSFVSGKVFTADIHQRFRSPRDVHVDSVAQLTPLRLHIVSKIASRFANTLVTSTMENSSPMSREAKFIVQLPQSAFISNFSMEVNGTLYVAVVKEKKAAAEDYEKAKNSNVNAGLVSSSSAKPVRGMDVFEIAINIAPNSSAIFYLNYQQLLARRRGYYEHTISIRPKQVVPLLQVDLDIVEPQGLTSVDVMKIRKQASDALAKGNPIATVTTSPDRESAQIVYRPTEDEQRSQGSDKGLDGDLVVRYDVNHGDDAGLIQVLGSYFVQYFSPSGLKPLSKNVVFVIDVSGSMGGQKIEQTRQAMFTIIDQLRDQDAFNLVIFNHQAQKWKANMVQATSANKKAGTAFVKEQVHADGSTNINDALLSALELLEDTAHQHDAITAGNFPMIVFLTDGQPTAGEQNTDNIRSNVRKANVLEASIFALGFGFNLDLAFLEALAIENGGAARRIYPEADAKNQLEGFFDEVSTPLLRQLKFEYPSDVVLSALTTTTSFAQYYEGSELVVSGKLKDDASAGSSMSVTVRGDAGVTPVTYSLSRTLSSLTIPAEQVVIEDFAERLWAYLTIKELLGKMLLSSDEKEKSELESKALSMSLEYNFVTPLTSFVVVQDELHVDGDDERARNDIAGLYPSGGSGFYGSSYVIVVCASILLYFHDTILAV